MQQVLKLQFLHSCSYSSDHLEDLLWFLGDLHWHYLHSLLKVLSEQLDPECPHHPQAGAEVGVEEQVGLSEQVVVGVGVRCFFLSPPLPFLVLKVLQGEP